MQIEAVYQNGVIRPLEPLNLAEGEVLDVVVRRRQEASASQAAQILRKIAQLPVEGKTDEFSGANHDEVLYPKSEQ